METWLADLGRRWSLREEDRGALRATFGSPKSFAPGEVVMMEGRPPPHAGVLLEGVLLRSRSTKQGRRQIVGLIVPGDLVEPAAVLQPLMDHTISAKTSARLALASPHAIAALARTYTGVADLVARSAIETASLHREWIVSCGQRDGRARVAHLMCELRYRLSRAGSVSDVPFPLSQIDIADAVGLSAVHVNRILQGLRIEGLASVSRGVLTSGDWATLARVADFHPSYLLRPSNLDLADGRDPLEHPEPRDSMSPATLLP